MMIHYQTVKAQNPDCIIFYRLGDFYEMFFEDAELCSKELDLTLTKKSCGNGKFAPMCGIPYHAYEIYLKRLIDKGYRVAICEQFMQPGQKGLVNREIIRIVTPGTIIEDIILESTQNNYIASVFIQKDAIGLVYSDISTGLTKVQQFVGENSLSKLDDTLAKIAPKEVVSNKAAAELQTELLSVMSGTVPAFYPYQDENFEYMHASRKVTSHFEVNSVAALGLNFNKQIVCALGALLQYLENTQKTKAQSITKIEIVNENEIVQIDYNTRRNLELVENMTTKLKKGSLLWVLDKTKTSIGSRTIKTFIQEPLCNANIINSRLNAVEELYSNSIVLSEVQDTLSRISDIERIASRISYNTVSPFDLLALKDTLRQMPQLRNTLSSLKSNLLVNARENIGDITTLSNLINCAIKPDLDRVHDNIKNGGFIKEGYNKDLDDLRNAKKIGHQWLVDYEAKQREATGIKNLKVGYNRVFGFYIEVPRSQIDKVPYEFNERKQTTANYERFVTDALREMETKILTSEEEALKLENHLYDEIKTNILAYVSPIISISNAIGLIDTLASFAFVAQKNGYTKPQISSSKSIKIKNGRHPVIEQILPTGDFVPNDTLIDGNENRTIIITGPNMGGKSTYLRQVALITLMAHMGSFVPATSAEIALTDKVFTRIGASDDLLFGQSTFMVEMTEVANILNNATENSLLLMDEVGRGTSTYDGLSIAWAVMEDLSKRVRAKTLFATHYHELTTLEETTQGVKNYRVMVSERGDKPVFLHKIVRGSANKSFGIDVAKMAGIPKHVIDRAKEVLQKEEVRAQILEDSSSRKNVEDINPHSVEILQILKDTDMNNITPLVAFGTLQNLVDKAKS